MKIDKTIKLLTVEGLQIKEGDKELTFGSVAIAALHIESKDPLKPPNAPDNQISGEEKMARWVFAMRISQASKEFECDVLEAAKLKDLIRFFPTSYLGACWTIIEQAAAVQEAPVDVVN